MLPGEAATTVFDRCLIISKRDYFTSLIGAVWKFNCPFSEKY
jgi:hypothetical protein